MRQSCFARKHLDCASDSIEFPFMSVEYCMDTQLIVGALRDRTRADILALVSRRPMCLTEIAKSTNRGVSSTYVAVGILERAGLVRSQRKGGKRIIRSKFAKIDLLFHDMR